MIVGHIPGFTRRIGESQGYFGLPIKDVVIVSLDRQGRSMGEMPCMYTLWHPTAEDLAVLNAGGAIRLGILGTAHPPLNMEVVPRTEFDPIPDRPTPDEAERAEGKPAVTAEEN